MEYTEILKQLRNNRGLNKKDIAELLNISQSCYEKYETGLKALPIKHMVTLCKFYNVSSNYIMGLPDKLKYPKK